MDGADSRNWEGTHVMVADLRSAMGCWRIVFALVLINGIGQCAAQIPYMPQPAQRYQLPSYPAPTMQRPPQQQQPPLRLAGPIINSPLPPPPGDLPPLQLGAPGPQGTTAPVMAAPTQVRRFVNNESALQYTAPELSRQTTIYLAEPQPVTDAEPKQAETVAAADETELGPIAQALQDASTGQGPLMSNPYFTDALETGKSTITGARKAVGIALGVRRCPECGKRQPDQNRIRVGMVRVRNFIRTGEGEVKVASSPNTNRAS